MGDSDSYHEFNEIAGNFNFYEALNIEKNIFHHIIETCVKIKRRYEDKDKIVYFNSIQVKNLIKYYRGKDGKINYKIKPKSSQDLARWENFHTQFYDMVKYISLALRIRDEVCFTCYASKFFSGVEMDQNDDESDMDNVENIEDFNYNEPALEKTSKTKHSQLQDIPPQRSCVCPIGQISKCVCDIETMEFLKGASKFIKEIYDWSEYFMNVIKTNIQIMKKHPELTETVYMMENVSYA